MHPVYIKAKNKRVSPRKQYLLMQREANAYEKRLTSNMFSTLKKIYIKISNDYKDTGAYPKNDEIDENINQVLLKFYRIIIKEFYSRTKNINQKKEDVLVSEIIKRYINTIGSKNIREISKTTRRDIRKIIDSGIVEGASINEIANNIRENASGVVNRARAFTIARTETHSAMNYGNIEAAKTIATPKAKKQWIAALDDRTREWHKKMNGVSVGIDEKFIVPYKGINYQMERPGDPAGGPANVINCRCLLIFLFEDEE